MDVKIRGKKYVIFREDERYYVARRKSNGSIAPKRVAIIGSSMEKIIEQDRLFKQYINALCQKAQQQSSLSSNIASNLNQIISDLNLRIEACEQEKGKLVEAIQNSDREEDVKTAIAGIEARHRDIVTEFENRLVRLQREIKKEKETCEEQKQIREMGYQSELSSRASTWERKFKEQENAVLEQIRKEKETCEEHFRSELATRETQLFAQFDSEKTMMQTNFIAREEALQKSFQIRLEAERAKLNEDLKVSIRNCKAECDIELEKKRQEREQELLAFKTREEALQKSFQIRLEAERAKLNEDLKVSIRNCKAECDIELEKKRQEREQELLAFKTREEALQNENASLLAKIDMFEESRAKLDDEIRLLQAKSLQTRTILDEKDLLLIERQNAVDLLRKEIALNEETKSEEINALSESQNAKNILYEEKIRVLEEQILNRNEENKKLTDKLMTDLDNCNDDNEKLQQLNDLLTKHIAHLELTKTTDMEKIRVEKSELQDKLIFKTKEAETLLNNLQNLVTILEEQNKDSQPPPLPSVSFTPPPQPLLPPPPPPALASRPQAGSKKPRLFDMDKECEFNSTDLFELEGALTELSSPLQKSMNRLHKTLKELLPIANGSNPKLQALLKDEKICEYLAYKTNLENSSASPTEEDNKKLEKLVKEVNQVLSVLKK